MDVCTLATISEHRVSSLHPLHNGAGEFSWVLQVHFTLRDGNLVIRAQHKDVDDIIEVVPHEVLCEDLPPSFIGGHVHWLNLSTSIIEIRSLEKPWEQSGRNWRIDCVSGKYRMFKGCEVLVDVRSPTWKMVSSRLECLDAPLNLIITTFPIGASQLPPIRRLSVVLPRYGLSFFVNQDGDLESRDFEGMIYDESQCIGTLIGLESRLILRPKIQVEEDLVPRCIIIPDGDLPRKKHGRYARFRIDTCPSKAWSQVSYYTYKVDTDLGRLTGYATPESKLYLAHLHALTSIDWRFDPLTGRTGIQEALCLLRSAGCRSSIIALDTGGNANDKLRVNCYEMYPQIMFALAEIRYLNERDTFLNADRDGIFPTPPQLNVTTGRARQTAYLFPFEAARPICGAPPEPPSEDHHQTPEQITLDWLLHSRSPPELPASSRLKYRGSCGNMVTSDTHALNQLFSSLRIKSTDPAFRQQYISRLHASAQHVREAPHTTRRALTDPPFIEELRKYYVQCRHNYMDSLDTLKRELGSQDDPWERALDRSGQWPQITPDTLLRCLASTSPIELPEGWKKCLISLALLLVGLQRARRLLRFALDNLTKELHRELENEGCDGWSPEEYPDWLLIQVEFLQLSHHFC